MADGCVKGIVPPGSWPHSKTQNHYCDLLMNATSCGMTCCGAFSINLALPEQVIVIINSEMGLV
jgi:hypothetical protein